MRSRNDPLSPRGILRTLPRVVDDLPLWAHLNITWRCNLDCAYCTEYDNTRDDVPAPTVLQRLDHCRDLGVLHADFIGGEPLVHPDLVALVDGATRRGLSTGMTTNGFLLTRASLDELVSAGLGRLQISVDAVRPRAGVPKSLRTLRGKIELAARAPLWFRVNTVLCDETLDDVEEVAAFCFDLGVPVSFSVVHERGRLPAGSARLRERLAWLRRQRQAGAPVSTPYYLLHYYERALAGRPMDWTCAGGCKTFYVSPEGRFQPCSQVASERDFLSVTRADLAAGRARKGCEPGCGVDCVVQTSLPYSNTADILAVEARDRLGALLR